MGTGRRTGAFGQTIKDLRLATFNGSFKQPAEFFEARAESDPDLGGRYAETGGIWRVRRVA